MQGVTPRLLSLTSCALADSGTSTVLTRYESLRLYLCQRERTLRGTRYNTRDELIRAIGRSIQNINKDGRADGVRRLPNIWLKVISKMVTILKVHKCCTPVNKAMSEISNCCHYFLFNSCIIIIRVFCTRAGLSLQSQAQRLQFCPKAGFPRKLRNQNCSFTRDE